eukprot:810306-Rhodomonas_salina.2
MQEAQMVSFRSLQGSSTFRPKSHTRQGTQLRSAPLRYPSLHRQASSPALYVEKAGHVHPHCPALELVGAGSAHGVGLAIAGRGLVASEGTGGALVAGRVAGHHHTSSCLQRPSRIALPLALSGHSIPISSVGGLCGLGVGTDYTNSGECCIALDPLDLGVGIANSTSHALACCRIEGAGSAQTLPVGTLFKPSDARPNTLAKVCIVGPRVCRVWRCSSAHLARVSNSMPTDAALPGARPHGCFGEVRLRWLPHTAAAHGVTRSVAGRGLEFPKHSALRARLADPALPKESVLAPTARVAAVSSLPWGSASTALPRAFALVETSRPLRSRWFRGVARCALSVCRCIAWSRFIFPERTHRTIRTFSIALHHASSARHRLVEHGLQSVSAWRLHGAASQYPAWHIPHGAHWIELFTYRPGGHPHACPSADKVAEPVQRIEHSSFVWSNTPVYSEKGGSCWFGQLRQSVSWVGWHGALRYCPSVHTVHGLHLPLAK